MRVITRICLYVCVLFLHYLSIFPGRRGLAHASSVPGHSTHFEMWLQIAKQASPLSRIHGPHAENICGRSFAAHRLLCFDSPSMVRANPISFLLLLFLNIILYMNTEITLLLAIKGCLETIIRNGKTNLKSGSQCSRHWHCAWDSFEWPSEQLCWILWDDRVRGTWHDNNQINVSLK